MASPVVYGKGTRLEKQHIDFRVGCAASFVGRGFSPKDCEKTCVTVQCLMENTLMWQVGGLPLQARARSRVRGRAAPGRPPGRRLAVVRWLQTQRQLWAEQRLSQSQLRYMALLGAHLLHISRGSFRSDVHHIQMLLRTESRDAGPCLVRTCCVLAGGRSEAVCITQMLYDIEMKRHRAILKESS